MSIESQADYFECAFCETRIKEQDVFWGDDGTSAFCCMDCRGQFEEDVAINRAESRGDWR